jgi:uncharacterized membrane protein
MKYLYNEIFWTMKCLGLEKTIMERYMPGKKRQRRKAKRQWIQYVIHEVQMVASKTGYLFYGKEIFKTAVMGAIFHKIYAADE